MLSWPSFALLKSQYPDAVISALVPDYTRELAKACKWIDEIIVDDKQSSRLSDIWMLGNTIRKGNFDYSISLFSELRTSSALWLAGVKQRFGPATKIAQLFLNRRLKQKRSKSEKPEYEYNLDLARHFIHSNGDSPVALPAPPYLQFDDADIADIRDKLLKDHDIPNQRKLIILHPGTGGSAINLTLQQYADIASQIANRIEAYFIITAGPGEYEYAEKLSELMAGTSHHVHNSTSGIIDFCKLIASCDLFIGGSTGPLHIAGALDTRTAAFYPAKRSATPLRWQTLNSTENRIAFSPERHIDDDDMKTIDTIEAANIIVNRFFTDR